VTRLELEWGKHHPAVFGVAYRLFGTVADAEDVVQDVWLRASEADLSRVEDLRAWLVTVAARRCYDLLTSARARRETYVGPWLPEPVLTGPDAAEPVMVDDTVTTAMLLVLQQLTPPERVAFVLHHAFELPHEQIAQILGRNTAACRQLASRAARKLRGVAGSAKASRAEQARVLEAYQASREEGDFKQLVELLAPDVVYITDGGGNISAARKPINGAQRVATVLIRAALRWGPEVLVPAQVNGGPGMLVYRRGVLAGSTTFEATDARITTIRTVLNPEKLSRLPSRCAVLRRLPDESDDMRENDNGPATAPDRDRTRGVQSLHRGGPGTA
jgi:RNA polymerase sigma factor (sigma-70 family)